MRFIQTDEPGEDDFSKRLSEFVARVKENEKFRKEFANMNLHDFDIMTEAAEEKAIEAARNALAMNLTAEQAAQITGLPLEQALDLQKGMAAQPAN